MDNLIPEDVCLHCLMHPSQLCEAVKAIDLKYTVLYIYIILNYNVNCIHPWMENISRSESN